METGLRQVSEWDGKHGYAQVIAQLRLTPPDLTARYGLQLVDADEQDGLGPYKHALVATPRGTQFIIFSYLWVPEAGSFLHTGEHLDPGVALAEFAEAAGLTEDEIMWRRGEPSNSP